uniref:Ammonium transporter AmtB-like domain-containing protein n=1 Tax=Dunaliella tertiolecta TaxID=3047 RepID=A0A6S8NC72_DUNTE|mmetsp:Transcript_12273/g.33516  ORF Transcript_12273/g.33516 Transcript_12273/m.33516 type:complete len:584 (+) Transcript_12273:181-1932(+)
MTVVRVMPARACAEAVTTHVQQQSQVEKPLVEKSNGSLLSEANSEGPLHMVVTEETRGQQLRRNFLPSMGFFVICLIPLMFGLTRYVELGVNGQDQVTQYYMWFIHVEIMVFLGFGFLMTFLRRYTLGAIMLNFLGSCLMFLVAILIVGAAHQTLGTDQDKIKVDLPLLIDCTFCAATGMVAYGAVIGKATPTQLMWIMVGLVPAFALNQYIVIEHFHILDMGGSNVIHQFGAYYGLAVSFVLSRQRSAHGLQHPKKSSTYLNDAFSLVGTLFLWIFWPSFNGALASTSSAATTVPSAEGHAASEQFLCVINTVISLSGACVATFMTSVLVGGRMKAEHIQNATLAGGVAMGAACSIPITPAGAMVVGMAAGALSTLGFEYLTPFLDTRLGVRDSCGVHNLHGLPGILGSFVAGLASLGMTTKDYFTRDDCADNTPRECGGLQLGYQLAGVCVALCISIAWGLIVGIIVTKVNPLKEPELSLDELFDDGPWWHEQAVEPMEDAIHPYPHPNQAATLQSNKVSPHANGKHDTSKQLGDVELALDASLPSGASEPPLIKVSEPASETSPSEEPKPPNLQHKSAWA